MKNRTLLEMVNNQNVKPIVHSLKETCSLLKISKTNLLKDIDAGLFPGQLPKSENGRKKRRFTDEQIQGYLKNLGATPRGDVVNVAEKDVANTLVFAFAQMNQARREQDIAAGKIDLPTFMNVTPQDLKDDPDFLTRLDELNTPFFRSYLTLYDGLSKNIQHWVNAQIKAL